jgi:hypothetical protein
LPEFPKTNTMPSSQQAAVQRKTSSRPRFVTAGFLVFFALPQL